MKLVSRSRAATALLLAATGLTSSVASAQAIPPSGPSTPSAPGPGPGPGPIPTPTPTPHATPPGSPALTPPNTPSNAAPNAPPNPNAPNPVSGPGGPTPGAPGGPLVPPPTLVNPDAPPDVPATPNPVVTLVPPPQSSAPLTLTEVMDNVATRYPLLLAEMQDVRAAMGEELSAKGSFDPKWKTKANVFPLGYYQYAIVDSLIEQPLYYQGLSVFGGYRMGQGKFPIYYDGYRTNDRGEARVGLSVDVLRGGSIDEERAKLWKAEAGIIVAKQGLVATTLEFQRGAAYKYWEWIAAAKKLEVAKTLLDRALDRKVALDTRVARGDAAMVEATDNARAIVQREQQVVAADRALMGARLALSLYLRDERGNPVIPSMERVPAQFPEPTPIDAKRLEDDLSRAFSRRPEIKQYEAKRKQYEIETKLARNDAWPTLNVTVAGAKQFGDGFPERQPAALEVGAFLDIPLRTRKADGRAQTAQSRFIQYELDLRYAKDKIAVEVRDAAAGADAAAQRLDLARRELTLAKQLESAERRRFDMGDSTLLFVNLREQTTFEVATRELDALLDHQKALALYNAVIGGRDR